MKNYIIFLVIIAFLTGCTTTVSSDVKEKAPSDTNEIQSSGIEAVEDNDKQADNTEAPAIGGDSSRRVESVGESYKDLENMSIQNRSKLETFDIELCYFKMKNIPKGFEEKYASIWEIGFIANYVNEETCERLELTWWANVEVEEYSEKIKDFKNLKVLTKNDIEYYCNFVKLGDEKKGETPYHAEIRWIEDGKCLYVNFVSAKPIDESVLKYCELEKFTID